MSSGVYVQWGIMPQDVKQRHTRAVDGHGSTKEAKACCLFVVMVMSREAASQLELLDVTSLTFQDDQVNKLGRELVPRPSQKSTRLAVAKVC